MKANRIWISQSVKQAKNEYLTIEDESRVEGEEHLLMKTDKKVTVCHYVRYQSALGALASPIKGLGGIEERRQTKRKIEKWKFTADGSEGEGGLKKVKGGNIQDVFEKFY